jgi:hypothetical protein
MRKLMFGKKSPRLDYRTLMFTNYLTPEIAPPPPAFDNLITVYNKTKISDPTKLYPMLGNDRLGDCTIAGMAHARTVYAGLIGQKSIPTECTVTKLYKKLTGGPDTGLVELDVLNYWRQNSFSGEKILAYAKISDITNHVHVKQAIQLFGGLYLGFNVQENCLSDFGNHIPWTPGKLLNEGHAIFATSYDPDFITVLTWGNTQKGDWKWWDECVDEAYVILPMEAKNPSFCPGFDFQQLEEDLTIVSK